jgi:hypothetical protein
LIYDTIPDRAPYSQQRIYYLDYPCELVLYAVRNNICQITEPMMDQRHPNHWKVGWTQSHRPALAKKSSIAEKTCIADASQKLIAQQIKPDIVILDIGMPHLNGLIAARQILRKNRFWVIAEGSISLSPSLHVFGPDSSVSANGNH